MALIEICPPEFDIALELAYASPDNFTGTPIYRREACYLHGDAAAALSRAIARAADIGLRFKIFDGFRPVEAQWVLWNHSPDPTFLADPRRGSPHSGGVALDLTVIDAASATALEMGTGFDDLSPRACHGSRAVSVTAQRNRLLQLGLMTAAGWGHYLNEWWHYQLFNPRRYPLLWDSAARTGLMEASAA